MTEYNAAFSVAYCLLHSGFFFGLLIDIETDATYSSETSLNFQRTTRRYISSDRTFLEHLGAGRRIIVKMYQEGRGCGYGLD
jgi:hypothetical protein